MQITPAPPRSENTMPQKPRAIQATVLATVVTAAALLPGVNATGEPASPAGGLATSPELSETSRLADRRSLVVGDRAYSMSTADSLYPAAGWHIRGEMGGVWTPPIKLVDGIWFRLADQWLGDPDGAAATRTTAGWGYTRTSYEKVDQVTVSAPTSSPTGPGRRWWG